MKTALRKFIICLLRAMVVAAVIIGFICIADDPEQLTLDFAKIKLVGLGLILLAVAVAGFNSELLFPAEKINDDERI